MTTAEDYRPRPQVSGPSVPPSSDIQPAHIEAAAPVHAHIRDASAAEGMEAADTILASRLKAKLRQIQDDKTKEFAVPGWDGDLVMVARKIDKQRLKQCDTDLKTISCSTQNVMFRVDGDAPLQDVGGWTGLGALIGHEGRKPTEIISLVLDNPVRSAAFSAVLTRWNMGDIDEAEVELGE